MRNQGGYLTGKFNQAIIMDSRRVYGKRLTFPNLLQNTAPMYVNITTSPQNWYCVAPWIGRVINVAPCLFSSARGPLLTAVSSSTVIYSLKAGFHSRIGCLDNHDM